MQRAGQLSATAIVDAALADIAAQDPVYASFVTVDADGARAAARACDAALRAGAAPGALHGIPVAVKDLTPTRGLRTTMGSTLFADHVPEADDLLVARLRAAGAVIIGKTNTPEFGFGANCTNALTGPTRTPHDPTRSSGGSSGGSAAAVAAGFVPLALGGDFGGSVRTPAAFCGCVGLRPTPGRLPAPGRALAWDTLATAGFLARDIDDAALAFATLSGPDQADPTSLPWSPWSMPQSWPAPDDLRVAATLDFGVAPVSGAIAEGFSAAIARIAAARGPVAWAHPDAREAQEAFETLRAAHIFYNHADLLERHGARLSPTVRWNAERGRGMETARYLAAEAARGRVYRAFAGFFAAHDILLAPSASVLPFDAQDMDVLAIDGRPLRNIIDYLGVTYIVSLVGFPCLSIPMPATCGGPMSGLQVIARPGDETRLLGFARHLERELGFAHVWPASRSATGLAT